MRPRHDVAVLAEVVDDRGDIEHVGGLEPEVEFLDDGLGEQLDERRGIGERSHRDATDQVRCDPGHHLQVLADEASDAWALDLDHDLFAGAQAGGVDLGDRGGRQRLGVEATRTRRSAGSRGPARRSA